jgi:uncharacterized protein (DUF885 family)
MINTLKKVGFAVTQLLKNSFFVLSFILMAGASALATPNICSQLNSAVSKGTSSQKLKKYLDTQWQYFMTEYPEWATQVGEPGHNDRWTDMSLQAIARRKSENHCQLQSLNKIPSQSLKGEEKINFELAKRNLDMAVEGEQFLGDYLVLDQQGGVHATLADTLQAVPTSTQKDYEDILARLDRYPELVKQNEILLREGLKNKVTAVKMFLAKVPDQIEKLLPSEIEKSPLYAPFVTINATDLSPEEKYRLQMEAQSDLKEKIYPALHNFEAFLKAEYIPFAREKIAQSDLPNGVAWYAYLARMHTTTEMTPDQLHQLGLSEVDRISKEMEKVRAQVNFKGDMKAFNHFLLTDSRFFYQNKEDLMTGYRSIAKRIDPELPKFFKSLPELTYGVREMPEYKAKEAPAAYYEGGSMESGRPGYFTANTYDLKTRPKWGMEALTLHESVPGHHLQISLAQELKGLPKFRTEGGYTAFIEGWGLYAERLGEDLGFYKDPYSKYGELSYEMWRAVRLVVDTGMHSKGWSREKAIEYMHSMLPKSQSETEQEIDRYISWPAQALAYKVGQLKFLELREKAKKALGEKFNIREFHEELLRHGALPMSIIERIMDDWIAAKQKR